MEDVAGRLQDGRQTNPGDRGAGTWPSDGTKHYRTSPPPRLLHPCTHPARPLPALPQHTTGPHRPSPHAGHPRLSSFPPSFLLPSSKHSSDPIKGLLPFQVHRTFSNIGPFGGNLGGLEGGHQFLKSRIWKSETAPPVAAGALVGLQPCYHLSRPSRPWPCFFLIEGVVWALREGKMG